MTLEHGRPRMLSENEIADLRREMQASSTWMRSELLRRRNAAEVIAQREPPKAQQNRHIQQQN